jgi:hypothetical protein
MPRTALSLLPLAAVTADTRISVLPDAAEPALPGGQDAALDASPSACRARGRLILAELRKATAQTLKGEGEQINAA